MSSENRRRLHSRVPPKKDQRARPIISNRISLPSTMAKILIFSPVMALTLLSTSSIMLSHAFQHQDQRHLVRDHYAAHTEMLLVGRAIPGRRQTMSDSDSNGHINRFRTLRRQKFVRTSMTSSAESFDTDIPPSSSYSFLSTCVPGMAHILEKELQDLAASSTSTSGKPSIWDIQTSGNAAVTFSATREGSLCALCWLRTAHRILELIASTEDHDDDENNNNNNNKSGTYYIRTRDDIHDFIHERIDVKELLGDGRGGLLTLSVKAILNNPRDLPQDVSHSHYTALTVKNALCDIVRELHHDGIRPDVDLDDPDVPLVVILKGEQLQQVPNQRQQRGRQGTPDGTTSGRPANDGRASLSLYRSLHPPGSLHRRGYRRGQAIHKAAMKETMAAGLLLEAGWLDKVNAIKQCDSSASSRMSSDPQSLQMIDPMCGSGSLCLEAAMMAADIAPSLMRIRCGMENHSTPPVTRWKPPKITVQPRTNHESSDRDHSASRIWKEILLDATQRAKRGIQFLRKEPRQIQIWGNDIHDGALDIAESALSSAGLASFVTLTNEDCYDLDLKDLQRDGSSSRHIVVATNPPWGVRLTDDVADSWEGLRHFIRDSCPSGTEVWVLSGDKVATSALKLKRDRMIPIQTGDQHLRWIKYTIRGLSDNSSTDSPSRHRQKDGWEMQERTIKPQQQVLQKRKTTNNPTTGKNEWM